MGNKSSQTVNSFTSPVREQSSKRARESCDSDFDEEALLTTKRKKLKTTSQYIYEKLFVNGENSDITIAALGREWKLHKLYLCQAHYFASMFNGAWKESNDSHILMDIPDTHIDSEALDTTLGALYSSELSFSPAKVVPVLASATLLGLDGLIQQCVLFMQEETSAQTVCAYYYAAERYGQPVLAKSCLEWLQMNLMVNPTPGLLHDIGVELTQKLVQSSELFVMQVEMDVYSLLKKWLYIKISSTMPESMKELSSASEIHWKRRIIECLENLNTSGHLTAPPSPNFDEGPDPPQDLPPSPNVNASPGGSLSPARDQLCDVTEFLLTPPGRMYACVFRELRLQHVITDRASTRLVENDRIIPMSWLYPIYRQQWIEMVNVEQGHDLGPVSLEPWFFKKISMRCGRVLPKNGEYCWRWTGYNYGIDLLVTYSNKLLFFKRNTHSQPSPGGVSLKQTRNMLYNMSLTSLNKKGGATVHRTTGLKHLELAADEETMILGIDRLAAFPLYLSCQFLAFTPSSDYQVRPRLPPDLDPEKHEPEISGDSWPEVINLCDGDEMAQLQ